jgi:hypothetical protein
VFLPPTTTFDFVLATLKARVCKASQVSAFSSPLQHTLLSLSLFLSHIFRYVLRMAWGYSTLIQSQPNTDARAKSYIQIQQPTHRANIAEACRPRALGLQMYGRYGTSHGPIRPVFKVLIAIYSKV